MNLKTVKILQNVAVVLIAASLLVTSAALTGCSGTTSQELSQPTAETETALEESTSETTELSAEAESVSEESTSEPSELPAETEAVSEESTSEPSQSPEETETAPPLPEYADPPGKFNSSQERAWFESLYGRDVPFENGVFRPEEGGVCWLNDEQLSWEALGDTVGIFRDDRQLYFIEFAGSTIGGDLTRMRMVSADDPEETYYSIDVRVVLTAPVQVAENFVGTWGYFDSISDNDEPIAEEFTIAADGTITVGDKAYTLGFSNDGSVGRGNGEIYMVQIYGSPDDMSLCIYESLEYPEDMLGLQLEIGYPQLFVKGLKKIELTADNLQEVFDCSIKYELRTSNSGTPLGLSGTITIAPREDRPVWRVENGRVSGKFQIGGYMHLDYDLTTGEYQLRDLTEEERSALEQTSKQTSLTATPLKTEGLIYHWCQVNEFEIQDNILTCMVWTEVVPEDVTVQGMVWYQEK